MRLQLTILNNEKPISGHSPVLEGTWYSRIKSYETDDNFLDEDIITSPISHKLVDLL